MGSKPGGFYPVVLRLRNRPVLVVVVGSVAARKAARLVDAAARVVADAKRGGVLAAAAADPDQSDFIVPAVVRRGDLILAISTGGESPALAGRLRRELERPVGDDWVEVVRSLGAARSRARAAVGDPERRRELMRRLAAQRLRSTVEEEDGVDAVDTDGAAPEATVVLLCGLPASGKTTTAMRLHEGLGGVLIRSCDVYRDLGIVLPDWVKRTAGFTTDVDDYARVRDEAYVEMARRASRGLAEGARLVIVDAVHGERDKRRHLYGLCAAHRAAPVLVWCVCPDFAEVQRRFRTREGREAEPEREASDLSVFHDIKRRWQDPLTDELPEGLRPTIVIYDTLSGSVAAVPETRAPMIARIRAALACAAGRDQR